MKYLPKEGRVHSIQTLGTLDGPGVRFVIFMQGCNLRCGCCHNPDTWCFEGGALYTAEELLERIMNYRTYFGKDGGDRKSTRLNSSHKSLSRMPSSA